MKDNVYQAPEASLVDEKEALPFYQVSEKKFIILYITTFAFYEFYWFYKNWDLHRKATGNNVMPIARALFSIFFTHKLFNEIHNCLQSRNLDSNWRHSTFATSIVLIAIYEWLFDEIVVNLLGEAISMLITMALIPIGAWLFLQAQRKVNLICDVKDGEDNNKLSPLNILWVILGLCVWGMFLFSIAVNINPEISNYLIQGTS